MATKASGIALSFEKWAEINRRLLLHHRVDNLLEEILDAAIELTDAERGFVIHSMKQELDIQAARNFSRENLNTEERFSRTIARDVLRKGQPVLLLDAMKDKQFSEAASVQELKIRSVLSVPLRSGARTIGLVYLDNRFREGVFQQEHLPLLQTLADQASLILEHTRLHRENETAIEALKKSQATVEKLNSQLEKNLAETSSDFEALKEGVKHQNEEIALRYTYSQIIGESPKIKTVLKTIDKIVDTDMNVTIFGESGTGKELIARAIHFNSPLKDRPFVAENCAAIPETLLESELFGYVRGAFTGAEQDRVGLLEMANGGTLFLDEIGDMPMTMQSKLLRVLQEGEVRRVGAKDYRKIDIRVISASNKDLNTLVANGTFRQDLFYRLHVARIKLPPLRERREDIPLLITHFLKEGAKTSGTPQPRISKAALKILMSYDWPGNIRELQNEMTRLAIFGPEIGPEHLSPHILEKSGQAGFSLARGLDAMIADLEKKTIADAMEKVGGNKVKAAQLLKIGRRTLYAKLEAYGIERTRGKFRSLSGKNQSIN